MPAPVFTQNDFDNLELVRQIVLLRLKDDRNFNAFYQHWDSSTERYVTFVEPQARGRSRFEFLADEVLWQLFIQGVITLGKDTNNPALPTCAAEALRDRLIANGFTGTATISGNDDTAVCP